MKQLRLSQEQLDAMLARSHVRVVTPMLVKNPTRGPGKAIKLRSPRKGHIDWAAELAKQIALAGLESPRREYRFALSIKRKFRADLAYPERMLLIEVDGGVHTIRSRWKVTVRRHQIAQELGYRVVTVMPEQVRNGEALVIVERELKA